MNGFFTEGCEHETKLDPERNANVKPCDETSLLSPGGQLRLPYTPNSEYFVILNEPLPSRYRLMILMRRLESPLAIQTFIRISENSKPFAHRIHTEASLMFCRAVGAAVPHSVRGDKGLGANTPISLAPLCPTQDDENIGPDQ